MGSDERELEDLLRIKKRRLAQLKRTAATKGYDAQPELRNEIEDLERETHSSSQVVDPIVKGELPDDIMAALRAYGVPASVNNALQLVEAGLYDIGKKLGEHRVELHDVKDKVTTLNADVRELKRDNEAGVRGRRRNWRMQVFNLVLMVIILGGMALLAMQIHGR
jgi:hypothetical protein